MRIQVYVKKLNKKNSLSLTRSRSLALFMGNNRGFFEN
jgi:hypothetical protein